MALKRAGWLSFLLAVFVLGLLGSFAVYQWSPEVPSRGQWLAVVVVAQSGMFFAAVANEFGPSPVRVPAARVVPTLRGPCPRCFRPFLEAVLVGEPRTDTGRVEYRHEDGTRCELRLTGRQRNTEVRPAARLVQ